jgi:hypothetical protein
MKKAIFILSVILCFVLSCCNNPNKNYNKITIELTDSSKIVSAEVYYTDTICFEVSKSISDSIILSSIKSVTDSLRIDSIRRDSLQRINFKKITKKINGGYNGLKDREQIWEQAKKVLK